MTGKAELEGSQRRLLIRAGLQLAGNPDCKFNAWTARVHSQITSGLPFKTEPKMLFSVSTGV